MTHLARSARRAIGFAAAAVLMTAASSFAATTPIAHSTPTFARTIRSTPMNVKADDAGGALKPGARIKADEVGHRVSLGRGVIAGLADRGALFGSVYPALSGDRGVRWKIDGPRFASAAADGANTTDHLAALNRTTLMAWGDGGVFVKTTTDRGKHWYEADFTSGVKGAATHGRRLFVRALGEQNSNGRFPTRRYVSTDRGRIWHRGRKLPAVSY